MKSRTGAFLSSCIRMAPALLLGFAAASAQAATGGDPLRLLLTLETGPYAFKTSAVARAAAGGFALAYQEIQGSQVGIFVRLFDPSGNPLGGTVQADDGRDGGAYSPAIAMSTGGAFVVAWLDNTTNSVYARRFSAAGTPEGGVLTVNASTKASVSYLSLATDPAGDFVVAWDDSLVQNNYYIYLGGCTVPGICLPVGYTRTLTDVYLRRYDGSGIPGAQVTIDSGETLVEAETVLGTGTLSQVDQPTVAMDPGGDYAIAWQAVNEIGIGVEPSGGEAGTATAIRLQRFNAQGTALEKPLKVDSEIRLPGATRLLDDVTHPVLAAATDSYALLWVHQESALYLRQFGSETTVSGTVTTVPSDPGCGLPSQADLTSNAVGDLVVIWGCPPFTSIIDAQRYSGGTTLGPVLNVFVSPNDNTVRPSNATVANDAAGNFVVTWTQDTLGTDGNFTGQLVGQLFAGP